MAVLISNLAPALQDIRHNGSLLASWRDSISEKFSSFYTLCRASYRGGYKVIPDSESRKELTGMEWTDVTDKNAP